MSSTLSRTVAGPVADEAAALAGSCGCSLLRIAADLARPWPLALAVDVAIDGRPVPGPLAIWLAGWSPETLLVVAGFGTVVVTGLSAILDQCAGRIGERAAERIGARLRTAVFARSVRLSLRWHGQVRSGELVSRLTSDVGRLLDAVVATTVTLVPDLVSVAGVLVLLLIIDPGLAALGLLVVPVLAVLSVRQRRAVRRTQSAARAAAGRLSSTTTDLVRNVAGIQAFGRGDHAASIFRGVNIELLGVELAAVDTEARWAPRSSIVLAVGTALVLVVGGLQVRDGLQTTGTLLVVLAYLGALYGPVRSLTRLSVVLAKAAASADRVAEILESPDVVAEPTHPVRLPARVSEIAWRSVSFAYGPGRAVLQDFDLTVRRGETVCLFGPSGVGKSTTLALALRLWDVDAGAVLLGGVDVRDLRLSDLRSVVAYVPQDPWLLDGTIAQNIAFGSRLATRAEVLAAGRAAGVAEFADRLPLGFDEPLGEGATRLSGGQRRRVALARAGVSSASVLLLDEPTASLDAAAGRAIVDAIHRTSADRATVIVTHDPMLAELSDRVIVLDPVVAPLAVDLQPTEGR